MLIFCEEICMKLFLWMLQLCDGITDIFDAISGAGAVTVGGTETNIVEAALTDSVVNQVFWAVLVVAVGLACIFTVAAVIKNMVSGGKTLSSIAGRFLMALLGTLLVLFVVVLAVVLVDSLLVLLENVFELNTNVKLSSAVFDACVGKWINGFSIEDFDVNTVTVGELLGDYKTALWIWPTSWKGNGMIDPESFYYLPALLSGVGLCIALVVAAVNMGKRLFELVFCYLTMPVAMSSLPLDDGSRFQRWTSEFTSKLLMAFGTVFAVNIFTLLLPLLTQMRVPGMGDFANSLLMMTLIISGAILVPSAQKLFCRIFASGDEMSRGGAFFHGAVSAGRWAGGAALRAGRAAVGAGYGAVKRAAGGSVTPSSGGAYREKDDPAGTPSGGGKGTGGGSGGGSSGGGGSGGGGSSGGGSGGSGGPGGAATVKDTEGDERDDKDDT